MARLPQLLASVALAAQLIIVHARVRSASPAAASARPEHADGRAGHAAPGNITCDASKSSATSISLHWPPVPGTDLYDLQCAGQGGARLPLQLQPRSGSGTAATVTDACAQRVGTGWALLFGRVYVVLPDALEHVHVWEGLVSGTAFFVCQAKRAQRPLPVSAFVSCAPPQTAAAAGLTSKPFVSVGSPVTSAPGLTGEHGGPAGGK